MSQLTEGAFVPREHDEPMTRREAARYLKVTIATVRRLELDGGLPTHRLTNAPNAPTRYYRSELDRWLRSRWTANNPGQQA